MSLDQAAARTLPRHARVACLGAAKKPAVHWPRQSHAGCAQSARAETCRVWAPRGQPSLLPFASVAQHRGTLYDAATSRSLLGPAPYSAAPNLLHPPAACLLPTTKRHHLRPACPIPARRPLQKGACRLPATSIPVAQGPRACPPRHPPSEAAAATPPSVAGTSATHSSAQAPGSS